MSDLVSAEETQIHALISISWPRDRFFNQLTRGWHWLENSNPCIVSHFFDEKNIHARRFVRLRGIPKWILGHIRGRSYFTFTWAKKKTSMWMCACKKIPDYFLPSDFKWKRCRKFPSENNVQYPTCLRNRTSWEAGKTDLRLKFRTGLRLRC